VDQCKKKFTSKKIKIFISMPTEVSVIIATKNRQEKLVDCLKALNKSNFNDFALIVVDQSHSKKKSYSLEKEIKKIKNCRYVYTNNEGKSKALNFAIKLSNTPILAFTDDDCVPNANWLKNIIFAFENNKKIVAVYGKTLPYKENVNSGLFCPAIFIKNQKIYINKLCKHWENIGFGNNMAWRSNFFKKHGGFKEWLGPGTITNSAEDAEIALRALVNKNTILYEPKIVVYHNKWLTEKQYQKLQLSYLGGEIACYRYINQFDRQLSKDVINTNIKYAYSDLKKIFSFNHSKHVKENLIKFNKKTYEIIKGLAIATYQQKKEKL